MSVSMSMLMLHSVVSPNHSLPLLCSVLQSPQSSPWKRPMVRALSTHVSVEDGLTVTYFIYTSRLLFELIADPAISGMMKSLEPVAQVRGRSWRLFCLYCLSFFVGAE